METVRLLSDSDSVDGDDHIYIHRSTYNTTSRRRKRLCRRRFPLRNLYFGCCRWLAKKFTREKIYKARTIRIGQPCMVQYPVNIIRNQKYNVFTFIPLVLFEQFKFFLNFYFLMIALLQLIPSLRIGELYTSWGPLSFVLTITLIREAVDDIRRFKRDKATNSTKYKKLTKTGIVQIPSSKIAVGDLLVIEKDERIPADLVLLRTSDPNGTCFLRTDQLDGETDWKLRIAVSSTQNLEDDAELFDICASLYAEEPRKDIHGFIGNFRMEEDEDEKESLSIENTMWANTVLTSGTAVGAVVYTGTEMRSVMNNSKPRMKVGLIDLEINMLTKVLVSAVMGLSLIMMCVKGFHGNWYIYLFRFVMLFSHIIPISLRVNLDVGKAFYSFTIMKDKKIPGTIVRSTTIPEELGRISYLFCDKTGTLTRNEMVFKKLHIGNMAYSSDSFNEVTYVLRQGLRQQVAPTAASKGPIRRTELYRVLESVRAIALCHNVTPAYEEDQDEAEADQQQSKRIQYQASSPDEIALVSWAEEVGLSLTHRDLDKMTLRSIDNDVFEYNILKVFPFTSESKRMGIILQSVESGEIVFYLKGADTVMTPIVQYNDWLEEEVTNMAREGLRTLVVAKKTITQEHYQDFDTRYSAAKLSLTDRNERMAAMLRTLEMDMELLCVTGVEDRLQDDVRPTLEKLKHAGIKIWMLTGDKMETAECIAKSACLIQRYQLVHYFQPVKDRDEARIELNAIRKKTDTALIIPGSSLEICLQYDSEDFIEVARGCPAVICCRCSPTQKATMVELIQKITKKRTAAIGDGGNDVSMIQAANVGIGIQGKEGNQASMAADFSLMQFSYVANLMLLHGRYCYKRSAALFHFVVHRGLVISVMQAIFSSIFYFSSTEFFPGFLVVGYATLFTNFPVFSLVLDKDVTEDIALTYPELYKRLTKGRTLTFKTFLLWVLAAIFQGGALMYGAMILFEEDLINIVAISFSSLILTELLVVACYIRTWHWIMIVCELVSLLCYTLAIIIFHRSFDMDFFISETFLWKTLAITSVSNLPLYVIRFLIKKMSPSTYSKLRT